MTEYWTEVRKRYCKKHGIDDEELSMRAPFIDLSREWAELSVENNPERVKKFEDDAWNDAALNGLINWVFMQKHPSAEPKRKRVEEEIWNVVHGELIE
jgi:hypothetical protein